MMCPRCQLTAVRYVGGLGQHRLWRCPVCGTRTTTIQYTSPLAR